MTDKNEYDIRTYLWSSLTPQVRERVWSLYAIISIFIVKELYVNHLSNHVFKTDTRIPIKSLLSLTAITMKELNLSRSEVDGVTRTLTSPY